MAIHAQSSCTLSTITDVEAVYTYYYLSDSTITVNEAPKDNLNPPGASSITIISEGENYVWTLTEPELDIEDDVIQTAVGKLYYIECVQFSDGTYDWGPLMTSSTYAAAKAAYNLSSQALAQATAANNATALLGGHFIYNSSWSTTNTPYSANVVQTILKNNVDKTQVPSEWEHNVHIGANGISLRYNEAVMAQLAANQSGNNTALRFYKPPTVSGNTTTPGALTMELTNSALNFYGSSASTPDATLNVNGLVLKKGGIKSGSINAGNSGFIYLSTENYGSNLTINSHQASNWREIIGTKFGVDADGTLYASNAVISGTIAIGSGSTIDSGATVGGTSLSNIAQNASTGAQAASDLSAFETVVSNTYATQEALSDVEEQIPDVSGLASKTDTVKSVTTETQYRLSNSSTSLTGSGTGYTWSTTIPTWSSGKYLWTRIATTYTPISGNATTVYKPGTSTNEYGIYDSQLTIALSTASSAQTTANGAAASVTTTQQYNLSSSTSSANGTWQDTVPTWSANNYIWVRLKIVKTPMSGTASTSYTPSESGTYDKALTTALSTAASAKTTAESAAPKSSAIAEEQRIYYRSNAVSNNSPIKPNGNGLPTTWVTETGDKYNSNATTASGWSKKITPIANGTGSSVTKYLYLWTCIQKKTVSGDVTYGDILLDDSTTVIDGGKIITGSITANEITGNKLSAIYADMGNITAGNITKGYNSINFDNSPATLEFKNNSTWANATKGIQWTGSDLNIKGNITATSLIISSGATVSGVVVPSQIANMATQTDVADASYSVEIQVSSIDYTTYSATLVAVPYYKGVKLTNSTTPSLSSITYQWYKNGVALSNTESGVTPSISGVTTSTLELGTGTDFGTDGTNPTYALYTCVISN